MMINSNEVLNEDYKCYDTLKSLNEKIDKNILIKVRKKFYEGCSITRKLGNFKDYY